MIFTKLEMRNVTALGDAYDDRIGLARDQIVALQRPADAACLDTHGGVVLSVEGLIAAEHLDGDRIGLDSVGASRERLVDQVCQELPGPFGNGEFRA